MYPPLTNAARSYLVADQTLALSVNTMAEVADLRRILARIDERGYKAYQDIAGSYDFGRLALHIDHVQGDPFAAPSKVRVRISQDVARVPSGLFESTVRRVAIQDFLAPQVHSRPAWSTIHRAEDAEKTNVS